MGGRGGGESLGNGGGGSVNIASELDVWSYRHRQDNEAFVDAINEGVRTIQNDFPDIMDSVNAVNAATLSGDDKTHILGYYSRGDRSVSLNDNYTDIDKMNTVYDRAVQSGYHPGRGSKSGTEAVAIHEMGHALTDYIAQKTGAKDLDAAAQSIVNNAYRATGGKGGTKAWAGKISGYAKDSFSECVAEAVADFYCNGSRAHANSKAIVAEMRKYK